MKRKKRRSRPSRFVLLDLQQSRIVNAIIAELETLRDATATNLHRLESEVTRLQLENEARSARARKANAGRRPKSDHVAGELVTILNDDDKEVIAEGEHIGDLVNGQET